MKKFFFKSQRLLELLGLLIMGLCFIAVMIYLEQQTLSSKIELTVEAEKKSGFQVFWRKNNTSYTESSSTTVAMNPERSDYSISLPSFAQYSCLRIDPGDGDTHFVLIKFLLTQTRSNPLDLIEVINTSGIRSKNQLIVEADKKMHRIGLVPSGNDPHFELCFSPSMKVDYGEAYFAGGLAVFLFVFGFLFRQDRLKGSKGCVSINVTQPEGVPACFNAVRSTYQFAEPGVTVSHNEGFTVYRLNIVNVLPGQEAEILALIKQSNPEAILRLQCNRSGEV